MKFATVPFMWLCLDWCARGCFNFHHVCAGYVHCLLSSCVFACSFVGCGCRMLSFLAPLSVLSLRVADGIVAVVAARVAAATVDAVAHGVWGCVVTVITCNIM